MAYKVKSKKLGHLKLTREERKRTLFLPVENTIYVPSTYGKEQKHISKKAMNQRVNEVRTYLADKFGGYTSVDAVGGYVMPDKKLIKEKQVKVTSFSTEKDFNKDEPELINQVGTWGNKWKQESIAYENEDQLFIIKPPKKKK